MKRLLFVLIALMGISATALAERVTAIEQIDPEVEYYIYSQRATLLYCTDLPEKLATTNGTQVSVAPNPSDPNQQWKFKIDGEDIYLYNVGANKYIGAEGVFEDTPTTPVLIEKKEKYADYPWYFSVGGLVFNSQPTNQFDNGILIDSWVTADEGNCYCIIPVEDFMPALQYGDLENGKVYTFKTARGYMYTDASISETDVLSTAKHAATFDKNDARFQWTVYKSGEGNYYVYNLGADKFIGTVPTEEGNVSIPLSALPQTKHLTFKTSASLDYPIMISVNGVSVLNHNGGEGNGCISWSDGWGNLSDAGSNHKVELVGDLSAELIAAIEAKVAEFETDFDYTVPFVEAKANAIALLNSGLYLSDAAAVAIAAIEPITCENTEESVVLAIAEVNSIVESTAINTAELFYIKSVAHGQYLTATTATSFAGVPERSHYAVWQFKPAVGGGYHLYEAAQQVYMPVTAMKFTAMNPVIEGNAGVYTIHVAQSTGAVYLKSMNPTEADLPCIHDDKAYNRIVGWRADVAASHWEITIVPLEHREEYHSGEDFQKALELLADNIARLEGLVEYLSDEYTLGRYYSTRGNETVLTGLQAAKDFYATAATSAGIEAIYKMAATVTDLKNTITAYQPLPGRYYRARSLRGGKAITANPTQDDKRLALEETNTRPFSSVMYVTPEGYVHSFSAGQLLTNFMGEDQSLLSIGDTIGYSAMFGVGETYGYYTISFGKNDDKKDVFLAAVSGKYVEGRTKDQLDSKVLSIDLDWELEAITELPIVVSPDGFATIYTPTAVKCPEGVKAYSGVINEAEGLVDLKSYPDGLIPAGTAVMIKAEASAIESVPGSDSKIVNLEVLDEATIDAQDNDFAGSYFTEEAPEDICTLQMINGEMGFYRYNGTYIKGFKGYLPIPSTLGTIRFRFADGTTTDIDAATLETAPTTYYDLSGRRVLNPTRGVYVTASGKKVFVK